LVIEPGQILQALLTAASAWGAVRVELRYLRQAINEAKAEAARANARIDAHLAHLQAEHT
jgi:outer membrane murein-binding lipoprotein Lpp